MSCLWAPTSFFKWTNRLSSKYTLTSRRCVMNVIEDTRNRVKSNALGMGVGSRRSISNVVHGSWGWSGMLPRRTNNLWDVSIVIPRHRWQNYAHLIFLILPVKPHPLPSRHDEWFLSGGKHAIETNTECADLLFVRISIGWISMSVARQSHAGSLRTDLLQSIPVLRSEWDAVVPERPLVYLSEVGQSNKVGQKRKPQTKAVLRSSRGGA